MKATMLITGASTGIWAATVLELAEGNRIFVHYNTSKVEAERIARDVQSHGGAPSATIYGAAKGAVNVFTPGLARELAPAIRVNAVAPGVIRTPFHGKVSTQQFLEISCITRP